MALDGEDETRDKDPVDKEEDEPVPTSQSKDAG